MNEGEDFDTYQEQKEEEQVDLEQKTQLDEERENLEQENDLEKQPLEWDIVNEVAPRIEIDELIAEYEMLEEELGELLPLDALILKEEELDVGNSHSDNEDTLIEIDVNNNTTTLQIEEKAIEVKEAPETYEIISISVPKEELEILEQQETNIQTEQDIRENIEEYQLDIQETESVLSCINQIIDELIAEKEFSELELVRLEKELEEIIEDKIISQDAEEIANETPEDIERQQQEELQIECNETLVTVHHDYEDIFCDFQSKDELINDISEPVNSETVDYGKTATNQDFDDETQCQLPFTQSEINLLVDSGNLEDALPQSSINELISQFIEMTNSNPPSQQLSFDLSFDENLMPKFHINLLDENFNSLEKVLEELESPYLLNQFHSQMEEEIQQLFDIETYQIRSEINTSLEMVSQGSTLPEPPPYDFQAELEEWEEETEEREQLIYRGLSESFKKARREQINAIYNFTVQYNTKNESIEIKTHKEGSSKVHQIQKRKSKEERIILSKPNKSEKSNKKRKSFIPKSNPSSFNSNQNGSQLTIDKILVGIKNSRRYSIPVLNYLKDIMRNDSLERLYSSSQIEFWHVITNKIRAAVKKCYKKGNYLHKHRMELSELAAWTKDMELTAKALLKQVSENNEEKNTSMIQTFKDFINGEASYLSNLLFKGDLSNQLQESIHKQISFKLTSIDRIDYIYTRINKIERCYESIILHNSIISIIRSSNESNTNLHVSKTVEILRDKESLIKDADNDFLEISDAILSLKEKVFQHIMNYIQNSKISCSFYLHKEDSLGNISSSKLPDEYKEKIIKETKSRKIDPIKLFKQHIIDIFASERTFELTQTDGWFKQALSWREKLDLLIKIEKTLSECIQLENIKNLIKTAFQEWETLKHSNDRTRIGGIHIDKWIDTLDEILEDKLGYKLIFNFKKLKGLKRLSEKKSVFLSRFSSKMVGEKHYVLDRWEGVIYDNLRQLTKRDNITNTYTLRIRKNNMLNKELLNKSILTRLEKIASRDLRNLSKLFNSQKYLEEIWVDVGYETPNEILNSLIREENNPLNILKEVEVIFGVIDGINVLKTLFEQFQLIKDINASYFQEVFINRNIINEAINSEKNITKKILKGKAFNSLTSETLEEVPIPRFSKSKGAKFADITNENEKSAAIRVFLDLITNSEEGREILYKLGIISEETLLFLHTKNRKIEFIYNWETGIQTNKIEGLTTGLLDGIITIKSGDTYLNEFVVEMVGTSKGQLLKDSIKNPFSNIIGDLLRIACYRALNKPGLLVYVYYDKLGNLNYIITSFSKQVGEELREAGAQLAVDINRPQVRKLLQQSQQLVLKQFEKVFKIQPNLASNIDLQKYLAEEATTAEIYEQFFKLVKIILGKKG